MDMPKFKLGDTVYFIGDHRIQQAIIYEVRCIERFEDDFPSGASVHQYIIYRLSSSKHCNRMFENNDAHHKSLYSGEYANNQWFPEHSLYVDIQSAIAAIPIEYLPGNDPAMLWACPDTSSDTL